MKICPVVAEMSLAEVRTDMTKLIFSFRIIFRTHLTNNKLYKKNVVANFTAICPVADELTVMDRRTGITKLTSAFRDLVNAPKRESTFLSNVPRYPKECCFF